MLTSYIFISEYKQRLTRIDRAIQQSAQGQQSNTESRHGPVEYRKLLQRFRQFLAEEDKFWTQFVIRYHRSFDLIEAHDTLVTLGILSEDAGAGDEITPNNGRNHFQFPTSTFSLPPTAADRESRLTILSKALVCLGDIARYREQYNEAGGRSKVGPNDGARKSKRGNPHSDIPRPRNFAKARTCYEQARFLTPHDGNPSHQLAIIASYEKDPFTSLVHYYRSLCVTHPYETASENMTSLLSKALEQRNTAGGDIPSDLAHVPKVQIEEFKRKIVLLHALWWLGDERYVSENDHSFMVKEAGNIFNKFYYLVSERHLPEEFITQLVILAQGALWRIRMHQDSSVTSSNKLKLRTRSSFSQVIEARIFTHLLSLYRALFEVGIDKLQEPPPVDSDLASRLIVEFRRTLPAMRIAGKWLIANYKYAMSDPEAQGIFKGKAKAKDDPLGIISPSSVETIDFWRKYADFLRALSRAFPADQLPQLSFALSEDIETRGFRPLKNYADPKRDTGSSNGNVPHKESEVHPNEVQLMRIQDILLDARALVHMENSPIAIYGNQFVLKGVESQVQPIPSGNGSIPSFRAAEIDPEDENMTELTSGTDDVLLRDAFGHLNEGASDEDEEDQIVWDPKPRGASLDHSPMLAKLVADVHIVPPAPVAASIMPAPLPPAKPSTSPMHTAVPPNLSLSITGHDGPLPVDKTTAEDLLKGFMSPGHVSPSRAIPDTLTPRSPFLFDRPGANIWSTSRDEKPLRHLTSGPQMTHMPQTRQHNFSGSQDITSQQSIWTHPANQNSQRQLSGTLPSSTIASHSTYPLTIPGYQRALSTSLDTPLLSPTLPQNSSLAYSGSSGMLPSSYLQSEPPVLEPAQNSTRHLSLHDPAIYSSQIMPSMSSIWGTNG
ncbi:hypothetical protein F5876DRAFT_43157 [Lentinula aff. lateritia]|uniref:Uncharacterized protein n=1 Tax=Lentinula aff. lateritia TaxID=2804960 RepID=A0ACC1TYK9_9AGAR|nr:hypothetical protein F5876DRAFT_43157 [Lentinula aff. lateritia]